MIKLTTRTFWDEFYKVSRDEWYFPFEIMTEILLEVIEQYENPFILHSGCGNNFLKDKLKNYSENNQIQLFEYDFSTSIFHYNNQIERNSNPNDNNFTNNDENSKENENNITNNDEHSNESRNENSSENRSENSKEKKNFQYTNYNLLIADTLSLPFCNNRINIIIEKGLFDSLTSLKNVSNENSLQMLNEYSRILCENGIVLIFSLFGPDSEQKDTLGLLNHPNFMIECKNLFTSPAEIPSQEFCYLYLLRYVK